MTLIEQIDYAIAECGTLDEDTEAMLVALRDVLEMYEQAETPHDVDYGLTQIIPQIKSAVKKALGI